MLPNTKVSPRQTLLFSATIPNEVHSVSLVEGSRYKIYIPQIASLALDKNHKFISTLKEEDMNVHEHVKQESLVVPNRDIIAATSAILQREQSLIPDRGGFKGESSGELEVSDAFSNGFSAHGSVRCPIPRRLCRAQRGGTHLGDPLENVPKCAKQGHRGIPPVKVWYPLLVGRHSPRHRRKGNHRGRSSWFAEQCRSM